ncbi:MAG: response regulator [Rhizomicrobium sp.]
MTDADSGSRFLDRLSVLVVEDEAIISFLLEDMLTELGASDVRHAGTLAAAMAQIEARMPDIAVLDVNLGGERVYPVAERLAAAGVRFLFTTGYGRSGMDPRWSAGIVVQKPFNLATMATALKDALANLPSP